MHTFSGYFLLFFMLVAGSLAEAPRSRRPLSVQSRQSSASGSCSSGSSSVQSRRSAPTRLGRPITRSEVSSASTRASSRSQRDFDDDCFSGREDAVIEVVEGQSMAPLSLDDIGLSIAKSFVTTFKKIDQMGNRVNESYLLAHNTRAPEAFAYLAKLTHGWLCDQIALQENMYQLLLQHQADAFRNCNFVLQSGLAILLAQALENSAGLSKLSKALLTAWRAGDLAGIEIACYKSLTYNPT